MNLAEAIARSPLLSQPPLAAAATVVVMFAFVVVAAAIVIDFVRYHRQDRAVVRSGRSLVETGSMTAFFVAYWAVIRFRVLEAPLAGGLRTAMIVAGIALILVGVGFNVAGRLVLKSSWANQIAIYEGQRLLTRGPYAVVRHPLYASLIWIFVGGSLVYSNPLSLVLALAVFVPMMYVRAGKEDALLLQTFDGEFERYRTATGMFLPRVRGLRWRT